MIFAHHEALFGELHAYPSGIHPDPLAVVCNAAALAFRRFNDRRELVNELLEELRGKGMPVDGLGPDWRIEREIYRLEFPALSWVDLTHPDTVRVLNLSGSPPPEQDSPQLIRIWPKPSNKPE